jgi:hypothetical protein
LTSVVVPYCEPEGTCTTITVAPGRVAPPDPVTFPLIPEVVTCAKSREALKISTKVKKFLSKLRFIITLVLVYKMRMIKL